MDVPMQPELATQEMKDAQLGKSKGMKEKLDTQKMNEELDEILGQMLADKPPVQED